MTNQLPQEETAPADVQPDPLFNTLALDAKLLRAVTESGYTAMTPIQAKAIPIVLAGRDVMGAAQTGTGKTAAFTLAAVAEDVAPRKRQHVAGAAPGSGAWCWHPTRELADQVAENVKKYAKHSQLRSCVVFGGIDMKPQTLQLKAGVEVLIATPGRLLDHIEAKNAVLNQVEYVVLDEADRMLDIGFLPDLQRILSYLPKAQADACCFPPPFRQRSRNWPTAICRTLILVEVARPNATATNVEQLFISVTDDDKRAVIRQLLKSRALSQAIIFRQQQARRCAAWRGHF